MNKVRKYSMATQTKKPSTAKTTAKTSARSSGSSWFQARRVQLVVFVVAFAAIGGFALLRSFASSAQFYLTPSTVSVATGQTFTVDLRINPGTTIDTVDATLQYDPAVLQYDSTNVTNSAFPTEIISNGGGGVVKLTRTALSPLTVSSDSLIASFTFTALKATTSSTLQLTGNVAYQGNSVTAVTTNGTVTVTAPPDTTLPTVTITSPANGATGTKFSVAANATDNVGVTKMDVYTDNKLVATSTTSSIKYTWSLKGKNSKGTHTLTVKAYDAAGNSQSASETVN